MGGVSRRAVLGGGAVLVGGTLAAAVVIRKQGGPVILRPAEAQEKVALQEFGNALAPTTPLAPPPDVTFTDGDGVAHKLAEFKGRGLLVNLWATWCVPCVAELPALSALASRAEAAGITVVPLSSDRGGAPVVRRFFAAHAIQGLPVWIDPKGAVGLAWGARGIPTTVLIDRDGRERGRVEGAVDWASDATLERLRALLTT